MTLAKLRTLVQAYCDDPDSDQLVGGSSTYDEFINEAYRACYAFINKLHSGFGTKTATGTISDGDTTLTIPGDLLSIYKLGTKVNAGDTYKWAEYLDYEMDGDLYVSTDTGRPVYFSFDIPNGNFILHPEADQDYLYKLIYRKKLVVGDEMSGDSSTPSLIPLDYHRWIAYEAAMDILPTDDRKVTDVLKLQNKMEKRMRSEYAKLQQASPEFMKGWNGRTITPSESESGWGIG